MWTKMQLFIVEGWTKYRIYWLAQGVTIIVCLVLSYQLMNKQKVGEVDQQFPTNASSNIVDNQTMSSETNLKSETTDQRSISQGQWFVDVKGAVKHPGLYPIENGQRIKDALRLAGQVTGDADTTQLNFAAKLTDEMIVLVPKKGDENQTIRHLEASSVLSNETDLVDLNQASESQLMTLPGVGQKRAQDIISFRTKQPFQQTKDLGDVPGVGTKTLEKLLPLVKV